MNSAIHLSYNRPLVRRDLGQEDEENVLECKDFYQLMEIWMFFVFDKSDRGKQDVHAK